MKELICIVCPIGCSLLVEESADDGAGGAGLTISGNRCNCGAAYTREEIRAPKRVVTATCGIAFPGDELADDATNGQSAAAQDSASTTRGLTAPRRIPVKTSAPCPKEKINELLADIYRLKLSLPVKAGERPIVNWKGLGIDVVVVRSFAA